VIIWDAKRRQWLCFEHPVLVLTARTLPEVAPVLTEVEKAVSNRRLHAAGWVSYEAAPAFDASLKVQDNASFPLVWFGLYPPPVPFELPVLQGAASVSAINWIPSISREQYQSCLANIKDYIRQGHTYQVNYTWRWRSTWTENPWPLFLHMIRAQPHGYGGFIRTDRWIVSSSSPELFFEHTGSRLVCRPMKGTAPRGLSSAEDQSLRSALSLSEKNRAENLMIVDMVRNDLGRVVRPGSIQVTDLFALEQHPTVWQMTSTVAGETPDGISLTEVFRALFPPASVTGAPKVRTMEIIAELEDSPRGVYTGALGFVAPDRGAQFNVAIRTVTIDQQSGKAVFGVGGGIVWDSSESDEYDECLSKSRVLTYYLPEFSLIESMLWTPEEGLFLINLHLDRLEASARFFGFPFDRRAIEMSLASECRPLPNRAHKIRLLYSSTGGFEVKVESIAIARPSVPLHACLAPTAIDIQNVFLYHKTTQRPIYDAALQARPNYDEVLLWNRNGELTEFCTANLVVDLDGQLLTPPQCSGLLAGTYRAWLLQKGLIQERRLTLDDLRRCRRVLAINSVRREREVIVD
jgi:para-aminobenzoate synthetase/4-amino-4-deoxychorismate lyase